MPGQAIAPEILEEAADWLMRCRARPADPELGAALAAWCAADPRHAQAFARAERVWHLTGLELPQPEVAGTAARILPFRARPRRVLGLATLAAAAAALAIIALPGLILRLEADHATGTAAIETARLADGSIVTLAAGTALASDVAGETRHVTLLQGEAYFDIAHDSARPFRVKAGDAEIEVLGTAFDVDLGADSTRIAVARGKVAVRAHGQSVTLGAGEAALITPGGITAASQPEPQIAAWRRGLLVADNVPISEIVAKLDRYQPGFVLLPDAAFAARRVTGVFDLKDPAKALRGLAEAQGGRLVTLSPYFTALMAGS